MQRQVLVLEEKYKDIAQLKTMKEQVEELKKERVWAEVIDAEKVQYIFFHDCNEKALVLYRGKQNTNVIFSDCFTQTMLSFLISCLQYVWHLFLDLVFVHVFFCLALLCLLLFFQLLNTFKVCSDHFFLDIPGHQNPSFVIVLLCF